MNYPVTDAYLARTLHSAADQLELRPGLQAVVRELALYFQLSDSVAQLRMEDFEAVAAYAAELVRRAESKRLAQAKFSENR